jgi:hypothetical protein
MLDNVVPFARFLEIRERRERVTVELANPPATATREVLQCHAVAIDVEPPSSGSCGTRSTSTTSGARADIALDHQRAPLDAERAVRPRAARDGDAG